MVFSTVFFHKQYRIPSLFPFLFSFPMERDIAQRENPPPERNLSICTEHFHIERIRSGRLHPKIRPSIKASTLSRIQNPQRKNRIRNRYSGSGIFPFHFLPIGTQARNRSQKKNCTEKKNFPLSKNIPVFHPSELVFLFAFSVFSVCNRMGPGFHFSCLPHPRPNPIPVTSTKTMKIRLRSIRNRT